MAFQNISGHLCGGYRWLLPWLAWQMRDALDGVFAVDWNSSSSYINFIAFIAQACFRGEN